MSDSIKDTTVQVSAAANGPDVSLSNGTKDNDLATAKVEGTSPKSSPPPIAQSETSANQPAEPSDNNKDGEGDMQDDSEAETVLTSPVKKREALKRANGIKEEQIDQNGASTNGSNISTTLESKENGVANSGSITNGSKNEHSDGDIEVHKIEKRNRHDESSDMSSVHSLSEEGESDASGESQDMQQADDKDQNLNPNPRKRKYREASFGQKRNSMEPPKRRRRASVTADQDHDGSSDEGTPPPRLRSHRRTTSAQNNLEDGFDAENVPRSNGRRRRAASHFPVRDNKLSRTQWESDTSSETSHKNPQSRIARSLGRSVSTPGRPMGRDHKRHVNKYGFTHLAQACETGDLDQVKEWRQKDPEQLEQREYAGNTPLQVASLNGHAEIVEYLLQEGCNQHCVNTDKDTPLIDAVENSHAEVVKLLLDAGVDPLRQNMKGQQALDVIGEDHEYGPELRVMLREAIERWKAEGRDKQAQREEEERSARPGPKQGLHFMARTSENLKKLVSDNDRDGVREFLDAHVAVDNTIVAAAAKTGDVYLLNMLLVDLSPKMARSKADKPMLAVIGTSHFEMVKTLTQLDQFNPTLRTKGSGLTWYEIAEQRQGPYWRQEYELLLRLYSAAQSSTRLSSSPVARRENGVRRPRSQDRQKDSEFDSDNAGSPDIAKSKRRLLSRKDMRAASRRRSISSDSSHVASSPEPVRKSAAAEQEEKPRRKPGRPRTKSLSQAESKQHKRLRSSSTRDQPAMFDNPRPDSAKRRKLDEKAIHDDAIDEEIDGGNMTVDTAMNDRDAEAKAVKLRAEEQERIQAAEAAKAARIEEEQANKRREAERIEKERQEVEEKRVKLEQEMEKLSSALRHIMSTRSWSPLDKASYIKRRFMPIQAARGRDITTDPKVADLDAAYMLNYTAAGILSGQAAYDLLSIPTDKTDAPTPTPFADTRTYALDPDDRIEMLTALRADNLVHALPKSASSDSSTFEAELEAMHAKSATIAADKKLFLSLPSLHWIPVKDFLHALEVLQTSDIESYAHLSHLGSGVADMAFDACLDDSAFRTPPPGESEATTPKTGPLVGKTKVEIVDA